MCALVWKRIQNVRQLQFSRRSNPAVIATTTLSRARTTGQDGSRRLPNQPQSSQRRPYQYPPSGPQQPYAPPGSQAIPPTAPAGYPNRAGYPQQGAPKRGRRKVRVGRIGCLTLVALIALIVITGFLTVPKVLAFGSAISTQSPLSTQTGYMNTSTRTNILIMGYGGGTHQGAFLTDSLTIISVLPQSHHTSLISVPRDLWVQDPPNSGNYSKINALYENTSNDNADPSAGGTALDQKVSTITGLDVPYWLTIDFTGFKKFIDSIGGVDVNVPNAFNACYPANDDSTVNASWIKVQFNKGMQHMDGATAIEYARAREPLEVCNMGTSENQAELSDFARSARQQLIMQAALKTVKQITTWPRLYAALDALQQTIRTNMSLADLATFALKMDLSDPKASHIGLSNQNVLQDAVSSDGADILEPTNGDWSVIPPYVKQHLYN